MNTGWGYWLCTTMYLTKTVLLSIFAETLCYVHIESNKDGIEGGNITLRCTTNITNILVASWYDSATKVTASQGSNCKGDGFLNNTNLYETGCDGNVYTVTILKLTAEQHGNKWICEILDNNLKEEKSEPFEFHIKVPVGNVTLNGPNADFESTQDCIENETLKFECITLQGRPPPKVNWFIGSSYQAGYLNITNLSQCSQCNEAPDAYDVTKSNMSLKVLKLFSKMGVFCNASNVPERPPVHSQQVVLNVGYSPSVEDIPDTKVIEGYNLTKICKVTVGYPVNFSLAWNDSDGKILTTNDVLLITQVNRTKSGIYKCSVNNTMKNSKGSLILGYCSKAFKLDVLYPPTMVVVGLENDGINENITKNNISFIEDLSLSVRFKCFANSNPAPSNYYWRGVSSNNTALLELQRSRNYSGRYSCFAVNSMTDTENNTQQGNGSQTFYLEFLHPPELQLPENISVIEKTNFSTVCKAINGNPTQFNIQWNSSFGTKEVLKIDHVNRSSEGTYLCTMKYSLIPTYGESTNGSANRTLLLDVLYSPEQMKVSLILNSNYSNTHNDISATFYVNENTSLSLNCSALGKPLPNKYNWSGIYISNDQTLTFTANRNTIGNVTCEASNTMTPTNKTAVPGNCSRSYKVDVLYPPVFKDLPQQSVIEGEMVTVSCAIEGKAANQTFQWFTHKNEKISVNNTVTIVNITRDHAGYYTCEMNYALLPTYGTNVTRRDNRSFHLNVLYPPENITITLTGLLSVNIDVSNTLRIIENRSTLIKFNCSATANPEPSSYWSGPKHSLDATLVLEATKNLSGKYTCHVSNLLQPTVGELQAERRNKTVIVDFLYPPDVTKYKEEIVNVGNNVNKDCIVHQGNVVNMTVIWLKDNKILASNRYLSLENVTTTDTGQYNCTVYFTMNPTYGIAEQKLIQTGIFLNVRSELDAGPQTGDKTGDSSSTVAAIIGALTAAVLVGLVVVGIAVVKKRGLLWFNKTDKTKESHEYENVAFNPVSDSKHDKRLPALPPPAEQEVDEDGIANNIAETEFYDPEDENPYVNDPNATEIHRICVSELITYVGNKTREYFYEEFENFPKGLVSTIRCTVAKRPEYVHLNRYQGIYPYDHSRVQISEQPDFFINANYIDGYTRRREYIASLGPTERHTLGFKTFWNMVWFEKSDVIVMLTNLTEPSGMKCEQYWPEYGKNVDVDNILIQSETEEMTAEYTVRTFTVSKDEESRLVTQLHYTAWPDKTVPESVTSLIEFRQRVKAAPTRSLGPLVVHCSAGVGRTGTYIALDRLIEEGISTKYVNVFDCVMSMRKQRVNMVQTQEQYVYLHQALVYCLAFDIEPVTAETVGAYIQTTSNNVFSQLYQQLKQTVEKVSEEYIEAQNKHASFIDWNRRRADIPGDRHRVLLSLDKEFGQSNYINAVYLASFLRQDHFIIAQSPLPKTVEDFVGMLYQEKSACIVALDDYRQKGTNNATYLPAENEQISYGYFSISCLSVEAKPAYVVRKLKLSHDGKHEQGEKVAYHFEFTAWKHDEKLPKDSKMFVEFVREIEDCAKESTEEDPHVIVHCMSGSDRSGLFCAVSNLIQKMELEQRVSVVNMLRRVRERRRTAISSLEQLKFCYHAVFAFVKKTQHLSTRKKSSLMHYENGV